MIAGKLGVFDAAMAGLGALGRIALERGTLATLTADVGAAGAEAAENSGGVADTWGDGAEFVAKPSLEVVYDAV